MKLREVIYRALRQSSSRCLDSNEDLEAVCDAVCAALTAEFNRRIKKAEQAIRRESK